MQTRSKLVTYEEAETRIGVLPTSYPRPNSKNIRALIKALTERLQGIPSYQSLWYGYKGFVTPTEEYALTGETIWRNYNIPGWHRPVGGNAAQQRDLDVQFTVASTYVISTAAKKTSGKLQTKPPRLRCQRCIAGHREIWALPFTPPRTTQELFCWNRNAVTVRERLQRGRRQHSSGASHGTQASQLKTCFSNWKSCSSKLS